MSESFWRKCTSCKKTISFRAPYWICNVSTCTRKRTGLVFCSMDCWDAHLPVARHKEAWAEERRAPTSQEWDQVLAGSREDMTFPKKERAAEEEAEKPFKSPISSGPGNKVLLRKKAE